METQNQTAGSFNELVFENRNKAYGAYVLRNSYNNNMSISLFLAALFFGLLVLAAVIFTKNNIPPIGKKELVVDKDSVFIIPMDVTPIKLVEPEIKKKVEVTPPHSDNPDYTATDKKMVETPKPNDIIDINKAGTLEGKDSVPSTDKPFVDPGNKMPETNGKPSVIVSEMPEFNGNLFKYLSEHLRYPPVAVENQTEGQVFLTFVVEKDGAIGDVKILKPLRDGCTEEAIRVVASMPKWKPGRNHGELVRVQYNLPIKFRLK